jgi:hypothetical protein
MKLKILLLLLLTHAVFSKRFKTLKTQKKGPLWYIRSTDFNNNLILTGNVLLGTSKHKLKQIASLIGKLAPNNEKHIFGEVALF